MVVQAILNLLNIYKIFVIIGLGNENVYLMKTRDFSSIEYNLLES